MSTTVLESGSSSGVEFDARLYAARHAAELVDAVSPEALARNHDLVWAYRDNGGALTVFSFGKSYVGRVSSGYVSGVIARRPVEEFRSAYAKVEDVPALYVSKAYAKNDGVVRRESDGGTRITAKSIAARFLEPYAYEFRPGKPMRNFRDFSYTPYEEQWVIADIAFRCLGELNTKHFEAVAELLKSLVNSPDTGNAEVDAQKNRLLNNLHRVYKEEFIRRHVPWLLEGQEADKIADRKAGLGARILRRVMSLIPGRK